MAGTLPYRGDGRDRPSAIVVPPAHMPLRLGRRPLKRWTYVAAFGERLMLCAARVRIGPLSQAFWAVWDRQGRALRERTLLSPSAVRRVQIEPPIGRRPGRLQLRQQSVSADLVVEPGAAVETASRHGPGWIWTRKHGGVRITGTVVVAGERVEVQARGCVDESAGYHARDTAWEWSAGVGTAEAGDVAWNLVTGVHDAPERSERTVWLDGSPREVGPVRFAADLSSVAFTEGGSLEFEAEAQRRRVDDLVVFRSDYVAPFGRFTGELPGAGPLRRGLGVMERHTARW